MALRRKNLVPMLSLQSKYLVSEQTTTKLTAETIAEDRRLDDIINNMIYNLVELRKEEENHPIVQQWRLQKSEFITKWADALAAKTEIGTRKKPIDLISTEIIQKMRELHFSESECNYVSIVLDKDYKRQSLAHPGININPDLDEVITIGFKDIDSYEPDELVEYVQKADGAEKLLKDRFKTKLNNLELNKEHAEELIKQKGIEYTPTTQQKKEVISTIKPLPNKCESYYAAVEVYNEIETNHKQYWFKLAKKLEEYPPTEDKEDDRTVARYLNGKLQTLVSEGRMLSSFIDDKYATNLWGWFKTLVDEESYGKHAAAVMNKIFPKGVTTKPRPLTRERVGDIKEKYWEYMKDMAEGMEWLCWWAGLAKIWDDKYHNPYNADRRNRESPKLSETAFGSSSDEQ